MNSSTRNSTRTKTLLRGINPPPTVTCGGIGPDRRQSMIAEAAYYRSKRRGFDPGHEVDDWLAAESQVDAALALGEVPILA